MNKKGQPVHQVITEATNYYISFITKIYIGKYPCCKQYTW